MNLIKRLFKKTHDEPDAPVSSPFEATGNDNGSTRV